MPYSRIQLFAKMLRFYIKATTVYRVHSPFIFQFCQQVLEDNRQFYTFSYVEHIRKILLKSHERIELLDLGAGSAPGSPATKKQVRQIAKHALSPPFQCRTLFRIVNLYKPKRMLEMGTSLGISTLYQAQAALDAKLITLEGSAAVAKLAKRHFKRLHTTNIELVTGNFDDTLESALQHLQRLDYAFIDGNHRKEAVLKYFEQCLKYVSSDSVIVLDDIYWSAGMEEAWEEIKTHPKVKITIDVFYFGIVFFKEGAAKKHDYRLVPSWWKPWIMGFVR